MYTNIKLRLGVHCGPVSVPSPKKEDGWWWGAELQIPPP